MLHTLDDLLNAVPGLRRARSLNAEMLRMLLDRQDKQCTWCGEPVTKGRRLWCSDACVEGFQLRCCPNTARAFVIRRDKNICQLCGFDTHGAESTFRRELVLLRRDSTLAPYHLAIAIAELERKHHVARRVVREVDHIVPVIEGGGLCTVDQLRLLCGMCHAGVTSQLARTRAGRRSKRKK